MTKDEDKMRQGERFDYSSIDVEYLRTLPLLPEWLSRNHHATTTIDLSPAYHNDQPPGHPKVLRYRPENWRSNVGPVWVMPDPDNYAYCKVTYLKRHGYAPEAYWGGEEQQRKAEHNRYYVLSGADYKKLWKPLPWDDLRMQCWECHCYMTFGSQYKNEKGETWLKYREMKVWKPTIDEHWTEAYKAQVWADYYVRKAKDEEEWQALLSEWVRPERNLAVLHIRKWFPGYQPNLALIENPKNSPAYEATCDPYNWFYRYRSLQDEQSDPIWRREHKVDG